MLRRNRAPQDNACSRFNKRTQRRRNLQQRTKSVCKASQRMLHSNCRSARLSSSTATTLSSLRVHCGVATNDGSSRNCVGRFRAPQIDHVAPRQLKNQQGRMAERSKALVSGTSPAMGEGSNPSPLIFFAGLLWCCNRLCLLLACMRASCSPLCRKRNLQIQIACLCDNLTFLDLGGGLSCI